MKRTIDLRLGQPDKEPEPGDIIITLAGEKLWVLEVKPHSLTEGTITVDRCGEAVAKAAYQLDDAPPPCIALVPWWHDFLVGAAWAIPAAQIVYLIWFAK